jgi:hypothetical protein
VPEEIFAEELQQELTMEKEKSQSNKSFKEEDIRSPPAKANGDEYRNSAFSSNDFELQSELEQLGNLNIDQLDNILSLADNMAVKLAY